MTVAVGTFLLAAQAQTFQISNATTGYCFPASDEPMTFGGTTVTIGGRTFDLAEYSRMQTLADNPVEENQVSVMWTDSGAKVLVHGSVARYVDVKVNGAHVSVTQSAEVSESTCGEITYSLKGVSTNGSFTLTGSYKTSIELLGLNLTNPSGAAIDIENGKRIALSAKKDTENFLTDGAGSQKAALYCKGHLELKGKGSLTVKGNQAHAISAKEYVEVKNLTLTVTGAVKDGINCNQYFAMESGTVSISGTGDDGIQVSYKDDSDREAEDTGTFTITGGELDINVAKGEASKGVKADGDINIKGGKITVVSSCNGVWDSSKSKTKASACLGADGNVNITDGTIKLSASGSGGKGISCDGIFTCDGGSVEIATTGGLLVYTNGTLNHNYSQSAERIASDNKSSAKGIKGDSGVVINGGKLLVTTASNNAEGIESKTTMTINGGDLFVKAYDDGLNSSDNMSVTGGNLTVLSIVGDAIDSNSNLYISGGRVVALGSGGAEQGLDAADENRKYVYVTGGEILSFGGRTAPFRQASTGAQPVVSVSGSIAAGNEVTIKSGGQTLVSFTIPDEYTQSSGSAPRFGPGNGPGGGGWNPGGGSGRGNLQLSIPGLVNGTTYTVTYGSSTSTVKASYTGS